MRRTSKKWLVFLLVWFVFGLAVVCTSTVYAETPVIGFIKQNTKWTQVESPYVTLGNVVVKENADLTIEPGVTIKFNSGHKLIVDGTLTARGTAEGTITFTAKENKEPGAWGGILFEDGSTDAKFDEAGNYLSGSILEYCIVEFAGPGVKGESASPFINRCGISNNNEGIVISDVDVIVIQSSTITNNNWKGAVITGSGDAILTGNTVTENSGQGVYIKAKNNTITINNNVFTGNAGWEEGGGIYIQSEDSIITINNNVITENKADAGKNYDISYGGGIYICGGSVITLSNNTVNKNTAKGIGGGIYISSGDGSITISNNIVTGNKINLRSYYYGYSRDETGGGGICINSNKRYFEDIRNTIILSDNVVTENIATGRAIGGGIWIDRRSLKDKSIIIISNNTLDKNGAYQGGGISVVGNTVTVNDNVFTGNKTHARGGGIDIRGDTVTITNNTFIGNDAEEDGGGINYGTIWSQSGTVTMIGNRLSKNRGKGAAIWYESSGKGKIMGNFIDKNQGPNAVYIEGNPTFTENTIIDNQTKYNLFYNKSKGSPELNATNNYWGVIAEVEIRAKIYDFFQDSNLTVVNVVPFLTENPFKKPIQQISTSSYNFSAIPVGSYTDWPLVISNIGGATLTVNSIVPDNTVFTIPSPSFPQNILPGNNLNVTVRFLPTQKKSYSGTLTIISNDPYEPGVHVLVTSFCTYELGSFLARLADPNRSTYVRIDGLSLGYDEKYKFLATELEERKIQLRDMVNDILISSTPDIGTFEGKQTFKEELLRRINNILQNGQIASIYFGILIR